MTRTKQEIYQQLEIMQEKDKKENMNTSDWAILGWLVYDAGTLGITKDQLSKDFPSLLGHLRGLFY